MIALLILGGLLVWFILGFVVAVGVGQAIRVRELTYTVHDVQSIERIR